MTGQMCGLPRFSFDPGVKFSGQNFYLSQTLGSKRVLIHSVIFFVFQFCGTNAGAKKGVIFICPTFCPFLTYCFSYIFLLFGTKGQINEEMIEKEEEKEKRRIVG